MKTQPVHQGRLKTPFYSRLAALDTVNEWHQWKGYTTPDELYCGDTEYFAIRNATAVFDLTPMVKHRFTGPDALACLNRMVTRDVAKIRPGRVGYTVWCNEQGQVLDDGTIFHLGENDYRVCSQERQIDWFLASADGFDVEVAEEVASRLGVEIEFVTPDWDMITGGNWGGRWDVSIGSMTITGMPCAVITSYFRLASCRVQSR